MRVLAIILALWVVFPAWGASPSEQLDDPALEARARALSKELRCLVCQNQSIDDSDAEFAKDMRLVVRERLLAGDTDEEVMAYLTDRYGTFVRLKPPLNTQTLILWIAPFVVVVIALLAGGLYVR
ncbi:MAG: cytochrome c-type biogenesis protein, partial [Pseudomonadota bacterium]